MKLPSSVRFFRKPDHISFLIGLAFIIISIFTYTFETKLISFIFFTFTIIYETYEISKGDRQIFKDRSCCVCYRIYHSNNQLLGRFSFLINN